MSRAKVGRYTYFLVSNVQSPGLMRQKTSSLEAPEPPSAVLALLGTRSQVLKEPSYLGEQKSTRALAYRHLQALCPAQDPKPKACRKLWPSESIRSSNPITSRCPSLPFYNYTVKKRVEKSGARFRVPSCACSCFLFLSEKAKGNNHSPPTSTPSPITTYLPYQPTPDSPLTQLHHVWALSGHFFTLNIHTIQSLRFTLVPLLRDGIGRRPSEAARCMCRSLESPLHRRSVPTLARREQATLLRAPSTILRFAPLP